MSDCNTKKRLMFDCLTSSFSVYMEGAYDYDFHKLYNGVVVNARSEGGYGHFAIRKHRTFWFKLPKFLKKIFPYRWIMWKNDREKMYELHFNDSDRSIRIVADMKNPSSKRLTFDKDTYQDLKDHIPDFLENIGYMFYTIEEEGHLTLIFV